MMNSTFEDVLKSYENKDLMKSGVFLYKKLKDCDLDFSNNITKKTITQESKKRKVLSVSKQSIEEISLKYMKKRLDQTFEVNYSDRKEIMREGFSIIETLNNFNEFVIFKYDFRDFFSSVSGIEVYENFIIRSKLYRFERDIIKKYIEKFPKCTAGVPISNAMIEIIAREFDTQLKTALHQYGLVFYSRYVDDGLMIFNCNVQKETINFIINATLNKVFVKSNVQLNIPKTKYLSGTSSSSDESFCYLGYSFTFKKSNNKKFFQYGIDPSKIEKQKKKLKKIVKDFKVNNNMELFRQRILFWASRRVFYKVSRNEYSTSTNWDTGGIIDTYGELRNFLEQKSKIERSTSNFLKTMLIKEIVLELGYCPYFLKNNIGGYNLEERFKKNRSLVFHPNIGWTKNHLINKVIKIDSKFNPSKKSYRKLVTIYCEKMGV